MVTADMTALEAKKQELQGLNVELSESQTIANQEITELMATNPTYDLAFASKMADINKPIATLQAKIEKAKREFDKLNESNRLEETQAMRSEVESTIKEQLEGPSLDISMVGATGTLKIVDGKAVVSLNPQFSWDKDGIEAIITSQIDPVAFTEANLTSLAINFKDGVASLAPMGKARGPSTGTKARPREYFAGGQWISARDFLQMLVNSGDPVAVAQAKGYAYAIENGSGAYEKAVAASARLGVESREKPTKANAA